MDEKATRSEGRLSGLPFLLGLFVLLTVLCALFFISPNWLPFFALLFTLSVAPVALTMSIAYGRGLLRTFAIGAIFPASLWFLVAQAIAGALEECGVNVDEMSLLTRLLLLLGVAVAFLVYSIYGAVAVLVRGFIEGMQHRIQEKEKSNVAATTRPAGCRQFSLRGLLAVMTLASILCGLLVGASLPIRLVSATFLFILAPTALTVIVFYGRGYLRTFAIGALFPASLSFVIAYYLTLYAYDAYGDEQESFVGKLFVLLFVAGTFLVFLAYGAIAMGVRWFVQQLQPPKESKEPDAAPSGTRKDDADLENSEGLEDGAFHVKRAESEGQNSPLGQV